MTNYVIACSKNWFNNHQKSSDFNKLKIYEISKKEELNLEYLEKIKPRYIFFPHWSWRVESEIFEKYECIVFHTAPLPFGRGGSPIQNLIIRGVRQAPVCALRMTSELDAGPIYDSMEVSLEGSISTIFQKIASCIEMQIIKICSENPSPKEQIGEPVFFKRLTEKENELLAENTPNMMCDRIRMIDGLDYSPAFICYGDYRIEFTEAICKNSFLEARAKFVPKIIVRNALHSDSEDILIWRNDQWARQMFRAEKIVSSDEHQKWFDEHFSEVNISVYMGVWSGKKIGVCHFKHEDKKKEAEVSINMNPSFRGKGLSSHFLTNAVLRYREKNASSIIATIKNVNKASITIFERSGFQLINQDKEYCYYIFK